MELFKLLGIIAINNKEAIKEIDETTKSAEKSEPKISNAFKKIGSAVATFFAVGKIKDFGLACANAAANAEAMSSQFSQVFGELSGQAGENLSKIAKDAGIAENRMKGSYTKIAAFAKTTGMETADALGIAERAMIAVADSAAFYDRSLEDTTESLQSFLKGNYENDAALGLSCTETTRNTAANKLYGKSFNALSEAQKQLTLLQMVEDANAASGALGQAARESDTWTNQTGNLKQAWNDFEAVIGATFLPNLVGLVSGLATWLQSASGKLQEFKQWCAENETIVKILATAIGIITAAIAAYNISLNAATIATTLATGATTAFSAVIGFLTSPVSIAVAAIGALIAIGVGLYKNWETIKEKAGALLQSVGEKFQQIKEAIVRPIEKAKEFIGGIVDKIKGFFNFKIELPKIKLPHFGIQPKGWKFGDLLKGKIPKLGIEWYAKAMDNPMIMTKPTAFGVNARGEVMAGGEKGSEVVSGTNTLMNMISGAVASQNGEVAKILLMILDAILELDANMGGNLREALAGTSFQVNNREFARLVKAVD